MEYPKTTQDVYNMAMRHLWDQNRQSTNETSGVCAYRGPGGISCAVGCFIPDRLYEPGMENKIVGELINYAHNDGLLELGDFLDYNHNILDELQTFHDNFAKESTFREYIIYEGLQIAAKFGLTPFLPPEAEDEASFLPPL